MQAEANLTVAERIRAGMPVFHNDTPPYIEAAYYEVTSAPIVLPYNRRSFFKVWLIVGKSRLHFADRTINIDQPTLIFSNPLVPYSFETLSEERYGYWCVFTEKFIQTAERTGSLQESPLFRIGGDFAYALNDTQLNTVRQLFDQIIASNESDYIYKHDMIRNYINLIIHEALKMQPVHTEKQKNASERITALFLDLLERQFPVASPKDALTLRRAGDYAAALSVHVNHLNYALKEITGKATSVHISERILKEAKALLKHSNWPIAEIGYSLGFEYPNHFNNFFKKNTGETPMGFRNN